uniref:Uncharacterized protein n=1 Tax=Anguilla anguilla TaxID=7936 RepID=A0A0E9SZP7_ANGAN
MRPGLLQGFGDPVSYFTAFLHASGYFQK